MSGTKKRKVLKRNEKKIIPLPKDIRDQLRMACAIRGYSIIKFGSAKKDHEAIYMEMEEFHHGKEPPLVLSKFDYCQRGLPSYSLLYDSIDLKTTSKNNDSDSLT